jgi:hypothetical protein
MKCVDLGFSGGENPWKEIKKSLHSALGFLKMFAVGVIVFLVSFLIFQAVKL